MDFFRNNSKGVRIGSGEGRGRGGRGSHLGKSGGRHRGGGRGSNDDQEKLKHHYRIGPDGKYRVGPDGKLLQKTGGEDYRRETVGIYNFMFGYIIPFQRNMYSMFFYSYLSLLNLQEQKETK